jgi:hypothetical protein
MGYRLALAAKSIKNLTIKDAPASMISADQNWNQPLSVPANRKTFPTAAPPSQNTKLPTVSEIRLNGDRNANRSVKITICSTPTPKKRFIKAVNPVMCWAGLAGAGKNMLLSPICRVVMSEKKSDAPLIMLGVDTITKPNMMKNPPTAKAVIKPS